MRRGERRTSPGARRDLLRLYLAAVLALAAPWALGEGLTLDQLYESPSLFGATPSAPRWSADSRLLAYTWDARGGNQRQLWIADTAGDTRAIAPPSDSSDAAREFLWSTDNATLLTLRGSTLWAENTVSGTSERLGEAGAHAHDMRLSPDGSSLAWLRNGDLWLFDLATRRERRLTGIGIAALSELAVGRYSRPEREIGPGIWGGPTYAWSPDGRTIAVHHVDRRNMRKVPFPNYLAAETEPNFVRRGYPGDPNEERRVGLVNVATGVLTFVDLGPAQDPAANQIVGFQWSRQGRLLIDVAEDTAERRWVLAMDEAAVTPRVVWHSERASRIYTRFAAAWDGSGENLVILSDRADRYGLYRISADDPAAAPLRLSDPRHDVLSQPLLAADGALYFEANGPEVQDRNVFLLSPGATPRRISQRAGENRAFAAPDGRHVAVLHSSDTTPHVLYTIDVADGSEHDLTTLPDGFTQRQWSEVRYVSFPSRIDDYTLRAKLLLPRNLDEQQRYPVLFGPVYSNTARSRWSGRYSRIQQLLVSKGYIVVQVDVRGSTGYGRAFREEFLTDFAGEDIEDIASAVTYLETLPFIDTQRMGIWGSSYGGTLSIYTLLKKPGLFTAAVAAASAVDPAFFGTDDVAIVRRPTTHPDIYGNRAEHYADALEDHLLIIHGMQDQVVPFKTTAAFAEALMAKGKDFDFAFAPGATHSWSRETPYSRYLFGKLVQFFDRHLMPAAEGARNTE